MFFPNILAVGSATEAGLNWTNISATVALIFLVYTIAKIGGKFLNNWWEDRKLKRMVEKAKIEARGGNHGNPGLPQLGGSNPAGGEVSAVIADPKKAPISYGEHENLCSARQNVIDTKLNNITTSLVDSGNRITKVETELRSNTEATNKAVNKLDKAVAILKDRENRGR